MSCDIIDRRAPWDRILGSGRGVPVQAARPPKGSQIPRHRRPDHRSRYRRLLPATIIHRNAIKDKLETASETDKPALESDEQAIKILANATSYGIFVELNVDEYVKTERMVGYGGRTKLSRVCGRWEPEAARACPSWWSWGDSNSMRSGCTGMV